MKKLFCLFTALFFSAALFAGAKKETAAVYNGTWILSVTDIDTKELSVSQAAAAHIVKRTLISAFARVSNRFRISEEEEYYRNSVYYTLVKTSAKKIADKQTQRDTLVFQGMKKWKFNKEIKKIDKELITLREDLAKTEAAVPLIENKPVFKLTDANMQNNFPSAPNAGAEAAYCKQQKSDALLTGKMTSYYGRLVLTLKLWTLYSRSWTFEERIIFDVDNIDEALDGIIFRLIENIAQSPQASLIVHAEPPEAIIAIDGRFTGRGESDTVHSAGDVSIEVFSSNYESFDEKITLNKGEAAEFSVRLPPLPMSFSTVETDGVDTSIYQGALYLGKAPLAVETPRFSWVQLAAESADKKTAQTAFIANNNSVDLRLAPAPADGYVEKARRGFYGAWGRLWIAIPLYYVMNGMYNGYNSALRGAPNPSGEDRNRSIVYQAAAIGAGAAAAAFGVESAIRLVYYIVVSNREKTTLVPAPPKEE